MKDPRRTQETEELIEQLLDLASRLIRSLDRNEPDPDLEGDEREPDET